MPRIALSIALLFASILRAENPSSPEVRRLDFWHQWRGPEGNGTAPRAEPPLRFGPSENLRWKVATPGEGHASPVVWGDLVFLLSAARTDRAPAAPPATNPKAKTEAPGKVYGSSSRPSISSREKRDGRRPPARRLPTRAATRRTPTPRRPPSPTAPGSTRTSARAASSATTSTASSSGSATWATCTPASAGARAHRRPCTATRSSSTGTRRTSSFIDRPGYDDRRDEMEEGARRIDHLDDAAGRRARRARPRSSSTARTACGATTSPPGELVWECGGQTVNAIPSPGGAGRQGDLHERLQGSRREGDPARCARGHHRIRQGDLEPGQGDSVRAVAPPLRGPALLHPEEQRDPDRRRRAHRQGRDRQPADPRDRGALRVPSRGRGTRVLHRAGRHGRRHPARRPIEVLATNRLEEPVDASPALVGKKMLVRGRKHLFCFEQASKPEGGAAGSF